MAWPTSDVNTGNADAGTDNPATFRTDVLDLLTKFNQLRAHVSTFWQGILSRTTAAQVRADLGAQPVPTETSGTTAGTGTAYTFTPTTPITAYTTHLSFWVKFHAASGANPTLQISSLATPPTLVRYNSAGALVNIAAGDLPANFATRVTLLSATQALIEEMPPAANVQRGYLAGLALSTAGGSATMTVAAGQAANSTNVQTLTLAAATAKTTAAWVVGSAVGGLDTGTIANGTWYYFYAIRRPDTGVVDVCFSLSASAPTLPANYTQFRYIGAGLTNGSAQWTPFTQVGDEFLFSTPSFDFNGVTTPTAALLTLTVPRRRVKALLNAHVGIGPGTSSGVYVTDPALADLGPSVSANPIISLGGTNNSSGTIGVAGQLLCWTNTSAQIRHRGITSAGLQVSTLGWTDQRGKDL